MRILRLLLLLLPALYVYADRNVTVRANDVNSGIQYNGGWESGGGEESCNFGAVYQFTKTLGGSFKYEFTGTAVYLYTVKDVDRGLVNFTIDDVATTFRDTYSRNRVCDVQFQATGLSFGRHVVSGTFTGQKSLAPDMPSDALPPGLVLDAIIFTVPDDADSSSTLNGTPSTAGGAAGAPSNTPSSTPNDPLQSTSNNIPTSTPNDTRGSSTPSESANIVPQAPATNVGAIAGGVVAGAAVVVLILAFFWWRWLRGRGKHVRALSTAIEANPASIPITPGVYQSSPWNFRRTMDRFSRASRAAPPDMGEAPPPVPPLPPLVAVRPLPTIPLQGYSYSPSSPSVSPTTPSPQKRAAPPLSRSGSAQPLLLRSAPSVSASSVSAVSQAEGSGGAPSVRSARTLAEMTDEDMARLARHVAAIMREHPEFSVGDARAELARRATYMDRPPPLYEE